jgi:hypothetical protein
LSLVKRALRIKKSLLLFKCLLTQPSKVVYLSKRKRFPPWRSTCKTRASAKTKSDLWRSS